MWLFLKPKSKLMKKILLLLSVFLSLGASSQVVINEVDADQAGTDAAEFIELYGAPNTSLDGLVVVFFNGSNDMSYAAYDLDGFSTDANGLFVLGNAGVNGMQIEFPGNSLQNGADAIAIYTGNATDWATAAMVTNVNLVDALVYGTDDADDTVLLATLTPGQIQMNEMVGGNATIYSMSRIPDGGAPFATSVFVQQTPSPGAFNQTEAPTCDAGSITIGGSGDAINLCFGEPLDGFAAANNSTLLADFYLYIITDGNNAILNYTDQNGIDLNGLAIGNYNIYGFTYSGTIDVVLLDPGASVLNLVASDCSDLSSPISVVVEDCTIPVCNGGTITSESSVYTLCADEYIDIVTVGVTGNTEDASFAYVLTNENNIIVEILTGPEFTVEDYPVGTYRIWGLAYYGNLDPATIEAGDDATMVMTDGACLSLSSNFVTVNVVSCDFENGCETLFFSEYFEGTSFNKAIEIYNPTNFPVNLDEYEVYLYTNGATTFSSVFAPQGILAGGETFLIVHPQADQALLDIADTTSTIVNFNGDDAIELQRAGVSSDVIGVIGVDPGDFWTVGAGTTRDNSLIRYNYISAPTTDWAMGSMQYGLGSISDYSSLGNHSFLPCSTVPQLGFAISAVSVSEEIGMLTVDVNAYNIPMAVEVQVNAFDGTAEAGEDYVNAGPYVLAFAAGNSTQSFQIEITNDAIEEDLTEFFTLVLSSSMEVDFVTPELTVSIEPNDQAYPVYTIAEVASTDINGIADSLDVYCELRGVVHGINFNASGVHFHIIDETDGIKVFAATENFDYTVTEGDFVHVGGYIAQFMGQQEIRPDYITLISQGNELETPIVVNQFSEGSESHLVTINCVELVDETQWNPSESFFVVDVTDGTNTFQVLVDSDTEFWTASPWEGHFTLTGIVEQMDAAPAFDNNYVLLPRYAADVTNNVIAAFDLPSPFEFSILGATVDLTSTSTGASQLAWDFGDGATGSGETVSHDYTYDFLENLAELTITLSATNEGCTDIASNTVDLIFNSIEELEAINVSVYPNPAVDVVRIKAEEVVESVRVLDNTGKVVFQNQNVNASSFTLDAAAWSNGVYHIQIQTSNTVVDRSLVVKK